ncbi:hypothetical protein ACH4Q6_05970 [Streptomyces lydicus]|uniref:hypothetical protein n=1 Tax=Streptomyces lydicus TaxID=47763 RepID=UPI00379E51D4
MRKRFIRRTAEETRRERFGGPIKRLVRKGFGTAAHGTVHGISSSIGGFAVAAVVSWFKNQ